MVNVKYWLYCTGLLALILAVYCAVPKPVPQPKIVAARVDDQINQDNLDEVGDKKNEEEERRRREEEERRRKEEEERKKREEEEKKRKDEERRKKDKERRRREDDKRRHDRHHEHNHKHDHDKHNDTHKKNHVCEGLKKFSGKNKILGVGMLKEKLVLVTVGFNVFIVSQKSLRESLHRLYLNEKPKHMSEIWPNLWGMSQFNRIKDHFIYNAFTVMDSEGEYFCITTKWELIKDSGPCYDMEKKEAFEGYSYYGKDDQVLLSASEPVIYYAMHKSNLSEGLQLSQFRFHSRRLRDLDGIFLSGPWRNLCRFEKDKIYSSETRCDIPYNIAVLKGFLSKKTIYLFGEGNVTSFSQKVYTHPGEKFPIKVTMFQDFFYCPKDIQLGAHAGSTGTYIGVILMVVILVALYFFFVRARQGTKGQIGGGGGGGVKSKSKRSMKNSKKSKSGGAGSKRGTTLSRSKKSGLAAGAGGAAVGAGVLHKSKKGSSKSGTGSKLSMKSKKGSKIGSKLSSKNKKGSKTGSKLSSQSKKGSKTSSKLSSQSRGKSKTAGSRLSSKSHKRSKTGSKLSSASKKSKRLSSKGSRMSSKSKGSKLNSKSKGSRMSFKSAKRSKSTSKK